jgi:galactarate dehydratase
MGADGNAAAAKPPHYIRMHERDNVAIVANDGGLQRGAQFPCGLKLVEPVPQGHKVALVDLAKGDPVLRYNVVIGRAARDLPAGSWVNEMALEMPGARSLEGLPISTVKSRADGAARGIHLRGLPQRRRLRGLAQHPRRSRRPCSAFPAWWTSR